MPQVEHDLLGLRVQVVLELFVPDVSSSQELPHASLQLHKPGTELRERFGSKFFETAVVAPEHTLNIRRALYKDVELKDDRLVLPLQFCHSVAF